MATMKLFGAGTYAAFASADLSNNMHYLAKVGTDGLIALAGNGDPVAGVIFEPGSTTLPVTIQTLGEGKAIAGAAVTAGDRLQSDGSGKAITLAGGVAFGIARNSAASGERVEFTFGR